MHRRHFIQSLTAAAFGTAYSAVYARPAQKHSMVGVDSEGKPFTLENYAGQICLVSFFTAACNLCTHDLKLMREFYAGNRVKNFALIGVNIDAQQDDFLEYARLAALATQDDQRFPLLWRAAPQHADTFGPIARQPTHFLLDNAQQQVFKREGTFQPQDWDQLWTKLSA